jgi:hypothetical protein
MTMAGALNVRAAGGIVGNGGDTVYCREGSSVQSEGYYVLDYLLALAASDVPSDFVVNVSWADSARKIAALLNAAQPSLAQDFSEFVRASHQIFTGRPILEIGKTPRYSWIAGTGGLRSVDDQGEVSSLPLECKLPPLPGLPEFPGKFYLVQTVTRKAVGVGALKAQPSVMFQYDRVPFLSLTQNPTQLSMMLVHEWAWSFTGEVKKVRELTRFLHLKATYRLTPEQVKGQIERILE